jgi:hypothetical protein
MPSLAHLLAAPLFPHPHRKYLLFLSRFDDARLPEHLFKLPLRNNRDSSAVCCPVILPTIQDPSTAQRKPLLCACAARTIHARTVKMKSAAPLKRAFASRLSPKDLSESTFAESQLNPNRIP